MVLHDTGVLNSTIRRWNSDTPTGFLHDGGKDVLGIDICLFRDRQNSIMDGADLLFAIVRYIPL